MMSFTLTSVNESGYRPMISKLLRYSTIWTVASDTSGYPMMSIRGFRGPLKSSTDIIL